MKHASKLGPVLFVVVAGCSSSSRAPFTFPPDDSGADALGDAGTDAQVDTGADATGDALADSALPDAPLDASTETAGETGADASDVGTDATDATDALDGGEAGVTFPACTLSAKFTAPASLAPASTSVDDLLGAITPDERTVVWESIDGAGNVTVYAADRSAATAAFAAPVAVAAPADGFLKGRVAVSPDGLRLVFVSKNGKRLEQLMRPTRAAAFATLDVAQFALVNALTADVGFSLSDPVVTADDRGLYFLLNDPGGARIRWSTRPTASDAWPGGTLLASAALLPTGAQLVRPTGASADGTTLFVWSEALATTLAVMRANASSPFNKADDLGALKYFTANTDCSAVYYSATLGKTDLDLAVAH